MGFEFTLRIDDYITYVFNDSEYSSYDKGDDESVFVLGEITINGNQIGKLVSIDFCRVANVN